MTSCLIREIYSSMTKTDQRMGVFYYFGALNHADTIRRHEPPSNNLSLLPIAEVKLQGFIKRSANEKWSWRLSGIAEQLTSWPRQRVHHNGTVDFYHFTRPFATQKPGKRRKNVWGINKSFHLPTYSLDPITTFRSTIVFTKNIS